MRFFPRITEVAEEKIADRLPERFALVFDGWKMGSTHFLALFASFPADGDCGYELRLLTFSPLINETSLGAAQHLSSISYILELYRKSISNFCALIGDNCCMNKALDRMASRPLIGCASYRFNLAVKEILCENEDLLDRVNYLMGKLKGLLISAKLRKVTPLEARMRNDTR